MKCEEMSDFEINCAVVNALGLEVADIDDSKKTGMTTLYHNLRPNTVWVSDGINPWEQYAPCNSWANTGPISEENMISVDHHNNGSYMKVWGYSDAGLHSISVQRKEIKRGICIVFLMMNEGVK